MRLFLLRHGHAEAAALKDQDRALSAEGEQDLRSILSARRTELKDVEVVLLSPYQRTQDTGNIARHYLSENASENFHPMDFLTPGGSPRSVIEWLHENNPRAVLLITHQPLVGTLLDDLCGFEPGRYRMGTSALAAIEIDVVARGQGELLWLSQPF